MRNKVKRLTTAKRLTSEARIFVLALVLGGVALVWAIVENAKIGDFYGFGVLLGALIVITALASYIVTSELCEYEEQKRNKRRIARRIAEEKNNLLTNLH